MAEAPVLFNEHEAQGGRRIGEIVLNNPAALNALTLEMVELMLGQLDSWQQDDGLAAIVIRGSGEKAFCAGGDVQALYRSATANPGGPCPEAETFFAREYRLNYRLHSYPKPLVCWGHGIVMGGGMGIFAGCPHRVVTEKTRVAMPEVSIALFPDVGGSYFLNRMPGYSGAFLALTGASINAADCLYTGLANYYVEQQHYDTVLAAFQNASWSIDASDNQVRCRELLSTFSGQLPAGNVEANQNEIDILFADPAPLAVMSAILAIDSADQWLQKAQQGLAYGSPLSAMLIYEQLLRSQKLTLAEVFQSELVLATNIVRFSEFSEGVRALLIDKDRRPQWVYKSHAEISEQVLESFFRQPWPDNPLIDLR